MPSQYAINVYVVIPFSIRARLTRIHSVRLVVWFCFSLFFLFFFFFATPSHTSVHLREPDWFDLRKGKRDRNKKKKKPFESAFVWTWAFCCINITLHKHRNFDCQLNHHFILYIKTGLEKGPATVYSCVPSVCLLSMSCTVYVRLFVYVEDPVVSPCFWWFLSFFSWPSCIFLAPSKTIDKIRRRWGNVSQIKKKKQIR